MNEFSEIGANLTAEESIEGDCMWMRTRRDLLVAFASVALIKQATAEGAAGTARLAVISPASPLDAMVETSANPFWRELFGELRRLGYVEGKNLIVGRFSTEGRAERGPQTVQQAIEFRPDVIFAFSSRMVLLLKGATTKIPVVGYTTDPVSFGIISNIAHPSGNITGVSTEAGSELDGKRLSLFKEMKPSASKISFLAPVDVWDNPNGRLMAEYAKAVGFTVVSEPLRSPVVEGEFRRVFAAFKEQKIEMIFVTDVPENNSHQKLIVDLANENEIATITATAQFVKLGALMSYGPDLTDLVRRAAGYIARVLKGEYPGALPYYQPTTFDLTINLRTAKALGLIVPPALLASAVEVID